MINDHIPSETSHLRPEQQKAGRAVKLVTGKQVTVIRWVYNGLPQRVLEARKGQGLPLGIIMLERTQNNRKLCRKLNIYNPAGISDGGCVSAWGTGILYTGVGATEAAMFFRDMPAYSSKTMKQHSALHIGLEQVADTQFGIFCVFMQNNKIYDCGQQDMWS